MFEGHLGYLWVSSILVTLITIHLLHFTHSIPCKQPENTTSQIQEHLYIAGPEEQGTRDQLPFFQISN